MTSNADEPQKKASTPAAVEHVTRAQHLLMALRDKIGLDRHPELEEALIKLEEALAALNVQTGGML